MFCTDPRTAGEKWCFWQISKQSKGVFTKLSVECDGAQVRVVRLTQGKVSADKGRSCAAMGGADGGGAAAMEHTWGCLLVQSGAEKAVGKQVQRLWLGEGVGVAAAKAAARSDSGGLDVLEFWACCAVCCLRGELLGRGVLDAGQRRSCGNS